MTITRILAVISALVILGALLMASGGTALGMYETPQYTVEKAEGPIEVRAYPALLVAEVKSEGTRKEGVTSGFRALADFIFGNNAPQKNVAMTTPVLQSGGQSVAMTTPVLQDGREGSWTTRFVMPSEYTAATIPVPNNKDVRIVKVRAKKYLAIKFSWIPTDERLMKYETQLRDYAKLNRIRVKPQAIYAYYDPPWTLPFMRRNEVLLELK